MYKLLIVDDEEIVCNGLTRFVDWKSLGFEVVSTALSVAKALVYLEEHSVDVLMTDIRMPIQTGLDLLRIVHQDYPDIKTLILSGHSDFDYAREAMRLGALDFITKPVNFEELKTTFLKIKTSLDESLALSSDHLDYVHLKKETLLNNIILSNQLVYDISYLQKFNLYHEKDFFIFRIHLSLPVTKHLELHTLKENLLPLIENFLCQEGLGHVFNHTFQEFCCLFYPTQVISLDKFFDHLHTLISSFTPIPFGVGVSNNFHQLSDLKTAYVEAGQALRYRIIKPSPCIFYREIDNILHFKNSLTDESRQHFLDLLSSHNLVGLTALVQHLFGEYSEEDVKSINFSYSLALDIIILLHEHLGSLKEASYATENLHHILRDILLCHSIDDVKVYLIQYMTDTLKSLQDQASNYGNLINTALLYIEEHYSEDLTLNSLADLLYLHPTYLSKLFKEKTGENFINYLTYIRIEKSKELLKDFSLKIYIISELVGYESPKYFSKIFKAVTNMTPREYRDSLSLNKKS